MLVVLQKPHSPSISYNTAQVRAFVIIDMNFQDLVPFNVPQTMKSAAVIL